MVYIDIESIVDEPADGSSRPAFRPGAIVALATLAKTGSLMLIGESEAVNHARQALRILEGEGVLFDRTVRPEDLETAEAASPDRHVLVGRETRWPSGRRPKGFRFVDVPAEGWGEVAPSVTLPGRTAEITRRTTETQITLLLNLDGTGEAAVHTGIGFFDHMLEQLVRHSRVDLSLKVAGDLQVDEHHTIEDTAIAIGSAFKSALGDKMGLERYGFVLPMDDALAQVALDWSGRSWLVWNVAFEREKIGDMPTEMFYHFFKSFVDAAACNLNISCTGENEHHKIESIFKAVGRCIRQSKQRRPHDQQVPSTKGVL